MTGKPQVARLGSKIQQSEELAKSETRQLKETTDKSMKEVTRTLATLVEQHRSKVDCIQSSRSQPSTIERGKCVFNICQEFLVRFEPVLQVLLMRVYIPYVQASTENAEAFDRLNRRLDNEVKNFTAMVKEVAGFIMRVDLTLT